MRGLLKKDCLVIWKQNKIMLLLVLLYTVMAVFSRENSVWISLEVVFVFNIIFTSISLDERCGWEKYQAMMPCSKRDAVLEKYILGEGAAVGAILLYGILHCMVQNILGQEVPFEKILQVSLMTAASYSLMLSISMPLTFWLGTEKSRMLVVFLMGAVLLLFIFLTAAAGSGGSVEIFGIQMGTFSMGTGMVYAIFAASVGVVLLSFLLSARIYEKRELI